ncbi:MAG: DNA (cytosine-5-)-methyltransferase [Candidatus Iainarchaeum sp.]|jgi:DNA (cytosine-5)-methyltransferase 1
MRKMKTIKLFDAFTGYGGASWGLKKAKIPFEIVGYSEIDKFAIKLYELNHKNVKNFGDITKINPDKIPDFDFFTGGFPCQTFSSIGKGQGELDPRGTLFYDIIRICEKKKPKFILLENVKGLTTNSHKPTFEKILSELDRIGYNVQSKILNSKDYGIPQNRERVWIFGVKKNVALPKGWHFEPNKRKLKKYLKDFLDDKVDDEYYLNEKQINRLIEITKVNFNVKEPLCFDRYNKKIKTDGLCMTITEPHHNIMRIVEPKINNKFRVRKMTPTEHFRFMGFANNEIDLNGFSYNQLCKCAGNGWDVNLVSLIMKRIYELY